MYKEMNYASETLANYMLKTLKKGDVESIDIMREFNGLISHSEYGKEANIKVVAEFIETINPSNPEKFKK